MEEYICLLFDADDAIIKSTTIVTAKTSADARAQALDLLRETPGATGFELWLDGDRVHSHFPHRNKNTPR